jgi:hypothetical protein
MMNLVLGWAHDGCVTVCLQDPSDGGPFPGITSLAEHMLNPMQNSVGKYRDKNVTVTTALSLVEDGSQSKVCFQCPKSGFYPGQHHIQLPDRVVVKVLSAASHVIGPAEPFCFQVFFVQTTEMQPQVFLLLRF